MSSSSSSATAAQPAPAVAPSEPDAKKAKMMMMMMMEAEPWTPSSWRAKPIKQQPKYADKQALERVVKTIKALPPLVQPSEVDTLKRQLSEAGDGKRFILQGGDCAERFQDCSSNSIEAKLKIILQMSVVLIWGSRLPLVRIGRIAGQYMKPRSKPTEIVDGNEYASYKGDSINSYDLSARDPDPERLLEAYFRSGLTLNYMRSLLASEFADLHNPHNWDLSFVREEDKLDEYRAITSQISDSLDFMQACGMHEDPETRRVDVFSSHEGLVLDFEESVTRQVGHHHYNLGAHFLWIGDRTRQIDGAHVEYFRGIRNPIGVKVGPSISPEELVAIVRRINPDNEKGRIVLITRFGAKNVRKMLPTVVKAVKQAGLNVVWECDPMHGNTRSLSNGIKTRSFSDIVTELMTTFDVHHELGTWLGGVHFEMTGDNVTECTGGASGLSDHDLSRNYQSYCDPRLNYHQSLEMAFLIARRLRQFRKS